MRAKFPKADTGLSLAHLAAAPKWQRVLELLPSYAEASNDMVAAILDEAARFADDVLAPLNHAMDIHGLRLEDGRVKTAPGHREAWSAFVAGGWPTLDAQAEHGGQQLPLALGLAVQEMFDRACPAFGMLPVPQRSAARLIAAFGDEDSRKTLLPMLASGELGATICISEAGAGSDVMQLRTRAKPTGNGNWSITGEKAWISYGDHDLTERLIHCVLARTDAPGSDRPEVSLFLVEGGAAQGERVAVRRIEDKMGLHGSPTCAIGFEAAEGKLLGTVGQGLGQMFVMITQMRLSVGAMGLGIASACTDTALSYAEERRQGGKPGQPVALVNHIDVQLQLFELSARSELLRGLLLAVANYSDIAAHSTDDDERRFTRALSQWFLPIVKTCGAHAAFENASGAIQVLGGAGYTADWPVEQALRDARVLAIFEGTSGMQAHDLVSRRIVRDRSSLDAFLTVAKADGTNSVLTETLCLLEHAAQFITASGRGSGDMEAGATAMLELATLAGLGWIAVRYENLAGDSSTTSRMKASASYWLQHLMPRAKLAYSEATKGITRVVEFDAIRFRSN